MILPAILFVPIPTGACNDGGSKEYTAITYKIVDWNRLTGIGDTIYNKTKIYFFPNNFKSIDELWSQEQENVEISFNGVIAETYPAQINAKSRKLPKNFRSIDYAGDWLDKSTVEKQSDSILNDIVITIIYSDCFFARTVIPLPYQIKLNGKLSDEWCIGDRVICTYENTYYDSENNRMEADMLTIVDTEY